MIRSAIRPSSTAARIPLGILFVAVALLPLVGHGCHKGDHDHEPGLIPRLRQPVGERSPVSGAHFAPHPRSVAPGYAGHHANPGFVLDLENLMGRAVLWIHGHTHTFFDYSVRGTRVVCNPRGYLDELTGFRPGFTVEI